MVDPELLQRSEAYIDGLFGPGAGRRHSAFLESLRNPALREALHRCHVTESDTTHLSAAENYLIAMAVLCALGRHGTAAMFAKTLRHLGVPSEKILEAVGRLSMWVGAVVAAEATLHVQRAVGEYDEHGVESLAAWFPGEPPQLNGKKP